MRSLPRRVPRRVAPPNAASKPPASKHRAGLVCCRLRDAPTRIGDPAGVDGLLHRADDERAPLLTHPAILKRDDLVEVVPGVDMQHLEQAMAGRNAFQPTKDDGILTGGEQQHWFAVRRPRG